MAEQGSERGRRERQRKREGMGKREWGAVGKTKLPTTAVKICPLLYCGVPSSCPAPAACLCFFVCAKVNPWASISRNNLSNIKTFNTTNDNGPATQSSRAQRPRSTFSQCARNFFLLPLPAISLSWVMRLKLRPLNQSPYQPLPSFPVLRSAQVIMLFIECRTWAPAPRVASLSQSPSDFPCPGHIVQQIGGRQRLHMGFTFSILCLYRLRIVVELTCTTHSRLWMVQSHCECDNCCADMFVRSANNHEYFQGKQQKLSLAAFQIRVYCDC